MAIEDQINDPRNKSGSCFCFTRNEDRDLEKTHVRELYVRELYLTYDVSIADQVALSTSVYFPWVSESTKE
jgi:hypothetical protein